MTRVITVENKGRAFQWRQAVWEEAEGHALDEHAMRGWKDFP